MGGLRQSICVNRKIVSVVANTSKHSQTLGTEAYTQKIHCQFVALQVPEAISQNLFFSEKRLLFARGSLQKGRTKKIKMGIRCHMYLPAYNCKIVWSEKKGWTCTRGARCLFLMVCMCFSQGLTWCIWVLVKQGTLFNGECSPGKRPAFNRDASVSVLS